MLRRQLVGGVCLLLVSTLLCVVAGEGFLRVFPGLLSVESLEFLQGDPSTRGVSHPYIGYLHTPNNSGIIRGSDFEAVYHTDEYGFRNGWPWPQQVEIVAVGDSLTFGYGVEDEQAWPALIDQALPHVQVINLGLIGAGPQQYLRVYERFGLQLHPQVLLVGIFARNDFWDADLFDQWLRSEVSGNYMVWRDLGREGSAGFNLLHPLASTKGLLLRNSYLFHLLREVRNVYNRWQASEPKVFQLADGSRLQLLPSDIASLTAEARPGRQKFRLVLQALEQLHTMTTENGTQVLVIFQPSKEEVYLPLLGEAVSDPSGPLREALERHGIPYLDLTPVFQERASAGEKLFFESDGHPNQQGYGLIAQEVLTYLQKEAETYGLNGIVTDG